MDFVPYVALLFALGVLLWVEYLPRREARLRREELLKRHPELRRHLR